jgi:protein CpxP
MKRITIGTVWLFTFLLAVTGTTTAQPRGGAERGSRVLDRLKTDLALTDSQATAIDSILTASRKQAASDREAHRGDREAMMAASQLRTMKTDKAIEALLTEDQITKYREIMKEMRQNFRRGMRGRQQGGGQ